MHFDLADLLKTIGPSAAIIFAAWIFMGSLQQRYDAAVDGYRATIEAYRTGKLSDHRRLNARDLILIYQRRCRLMNYTFQTGLISAILLLITLISAEFETIVPAISQLRYVSVVTLGLGLVLVIVSAVLVIMDSISSHRQLQARACGCSRSGGRLWREASGNQNKDKLKGLTDEMCGRNGDE